MTPEPLEIEELESTAEWRLRRVDADAGDTASAAAATMLLRLAEDLRRNDYAQLWAELQSIGNWLESRMRSRITPGSPRNIGLRIGVFDHPANGSDYLRGLLAIARGLI